MKTAKNGGSCEGLLSENDLEAVFQGPQRVFKSEWGEGGEGGGGRRGGLSESALSLSIKG